MRFCSGFALRLAGSGGIALAILSAGPVAAAELAEKHAARVIVLPGRSLIEHRLPAFVEVQPGRYLAAAILQRACTTPMLRAESLLLFFPDSQRCEQVSVQDQVALPQRLHQLTGRWTDAAAAVLRPHAEPFLVVAARTTRAYGPKSSCICPNTAPDGVVMCDSQTRTAGTPIATVEYLASDADGDALSGTFSYQHDADPVQSGLPPSLTSQCTPAAGSLQCKIDGNAPTQAGNLQLKLSVSDGIDNLLLTSQLQVLAGSDRIFAGGFESTATLSCSVLP